MKIWSNCSERWAAKDIPWILWSVIPFNVFFVSSFDSYGKSGSGRGNNRSEKPSDMWLHHDQMELASMMLDGENGRKGNGERGGKRVGSTSGSDGRCTDPSGGGSLPRRISEFDKKNGTSTSTLDRSRNFGSQYLSKSESKFSTSRLVLNESVVSYPGCL